eukprot:549169_1
MGKNTSKQSENKNKDVQSEANCDISITNEKKVLLIRAARVVVPKARDLSSKINLSSKIIKKDVTYSIHDIGGQRNERKKWMHTLVHVDCGFFVSGLDQYCHRLPEDYDTFQLNDNIESFKSIIQSKFLMDSTVVVILNKKQLFPKFIKYIPLTMVFGNEYKGRNYKGFWKLNKLRICHKILKLFHTDIVVVNDIANIIELYVDIQNAYWLDLVCENAVEFIRNKFLNICPNALIYEVNELNNEIMNDIIDIVHNQLVSKK